jgi:multimeric flavodoxin WrbA
MQVLMISGSRNPKGQTASAANAMIRGIQAAGGTVETVFLPELEIERCRQCEDNGWGICRDEGKCIIEDDFASLVDAIRRVDGVVVANPVYFQDLSESLTAFLHRLRRICFNEQGRQNVAGKPAAGICVAGGSGKGAPHCGARLDRALTNCRLETVDMVLASRQNLQMKLPLLEATGRWFAGLDTAAEG